MAFWECNNSSIVYHFESYSNTKKKQWWGHQKTSVIAYVFKKSSVLFSMVPFPLINSLAHYSILIGICKLICSKQWYVRLFQTALYVHMFCWSDVLLCKLDRLFKFRWCAACDITGVTVRPTGRGRHGTRRGIRQWIPHGLPVYHGQLQFVLSSLT